MFSGHGNDPMPSDKLMKLFIIQSISAFVANDYETGIHFLKEIKQTYAEHMGSLNPTLKQLSKEIIQSVDLFNPGSSGFVAASSSNSAPEEQSYSENSQPRMPGESQDQPTQPAQPAQSTASEEQQEKQPQSSDQSGEQPRSVAHELQELLKRRKERRRG